MNEIELKLCQLNKTHKINVIGVHVYNLEVLSVLFCYYYVRKWAVKLNVFIMNTSSSIGL